MTPAEIVIHQQRGVIEELEKDRQAQNWLVASLNGQLLRLRMDIITAASHAIHGNNEAALQIIMQISEAINNETTDQLANDHAGAANQNGRGY